MWVCLYVLVNVIAVENSEKKQTFSSWICCFVLYFAALSLHSLSTAALSLPPAEPGAEFPTLNGVFYRQQQQILHNIPLIQQEVA